jgi:RNA polymerase sigma factor (sigma-70 family)
VKRTRPNRGIEERIAVRQTAALAPLFPQLRREDIAAVARAEAWLAASAYDARRGVDLGAYLTRRVRWAVLHYAEKELPPAMRVFSAVLRAASRSGARIVLPESLVDPSALADEGAEGEDDIIDRLDRARALEAVRRAVDALPREDRGVFLLRFMDEETHEGIASVYGFSVATAKRRACAALTAVRAALREQGVL